MEDDKGKEEVTTANELLGTVEESLPELGLDERGGDAPVDGTGELIMDPGIALPFDVALMEKTYGPSHRGAVAPKEILPGTLIYHEVAQLWVAMPAPTIPENASAWEKEANASHIRFFLGTNRKKVPPYHICPPELCPPLLERGGLHVALTGLLIAHKEEVADVICGDNEWALHGSLDLLNFPAPHDCYEVAKTLYFADKAESWDLKRFGRLFGVIQVDASTPSCA